MDGLIKALREPSEDDSLMELKEAVPFKSETDSQQLALLGTTFTIAKELLPMVMSLIWSILNESKEAGGATESPKVTTNAAVQAHRDGPTRPDAHIYLSGEGNDLNLNSDPLPLLTLPPTLPYDPPPPPF
ncbi:exocyst complex component EXO84C [Tanacetum coccineum]